LFLNHVTLNINDIKQSTEALLMAGREVGPEANTHKTKNMLAPRHQNVGQNHNSLIANK